MPPCSLGDTQQPCDNLMTSPMVTVSNLSVHRHSNNESTISIKGKPSKTKRLNFPYLVGWMGMKSHFPLKTWSKNT